LERFASACSRGYALPAAPAAVTMRDVKYFSPITQQVLDTVLGCLRRLRSTGDDDARSSGCGTASARVSRAATLEKATVSNASYTSSSDCRNCDGTKEHDDDRICDAPQRR
jgi:hypothetical protein